MLRKTMALLMTFCLVFSLNATFASAETANMDVFKDAEVLQFDNSDFMSDAVAVGKLKNQEEAKYYSVTMDKSGLLEFMIEQNPKVELGVTLYDANGEKFESYYAYKGNDSEDLFTLGLPKGTYYVKVFVYSGTGEDLPFELDVARYYGSGVEIERNNSLETANPIKLGTYSIGYTDQEQTEDLFRFATTKEGYINLVGTFSEESAINYRLLDANGKVLEDWVLNKYEDYESMSVFTRKVNPGTYYIAVSQASGKFSNDEYVIYPTFIDNKQFEKEANNSIKQANKISVNTQYHGLISKKTDKDFYKFTVTKNKTYALNFKRLEDTTFRVKVLNSKGKLIKTFTTQFDDEAFVKLGSLNLTKGTYYLDVEYLEGESEDVLYNFSLK